MARTGSMSPIEVTEYEQTAEDDKDVDNRHEQGRHLQSTCQCTLDSCELCKLFPDSGHFAISA